MIRRHDTLYLTRQGKELVAHGFPEAQSNHLMRPNLNSKIFIFSLHCSNVSSQDLLKHWTLFVTLETLKTTLPFTQGENLECEEGQLGCPASCAGGIDRDLFSQKRLIPTHFLFFS